MTKKLQIFSCDICGNVVEVLTPGKGELVCCGQPMDLLPEQTEDAAYEKHVPVVEKTEDGYRVKVGSTEHPMIDTHYIEWIQLLAGDKAYREFLMPEQTPEATFRVDAAEVSAREYCNLHGLWRS